MILDIWLFQISSSELKFSTLPTGIGSHPSHVHIKQFDLKSTVTARYGTLQEYGMGVS
jgi:hypothetical protein